mgnify:CR=1 FL=1
MLQRICVPVIGTCVLPMVFFSGFVNGQSESLTLNKQGTEEADLEAVTIFADPLNRSQDSFSQPVDVLTEGQLLHRQSASIGEVLSQNPGMHNASFGSAVGRPVIRGLSGARVKILQNGLGVLDVASISPDHAAAADSQQASQVEVFKGPSALIFSSAAIGGVVNIVDQRIPLQIDESQTKINLERSSVDSGYLLSLNSIYLADVYALNVSMSERKQGDYNLPSNSDEDVLHNSDVGLRNASIGMGWFLNDVEAGLSFSHMDHEFALPGHEHQEEHDEHEEENEEEGARVALLQSRLDAKLKWQLNTLWQGVTWQALDWKGTWVDYEHSEGHADEGLTYFKRNGFESRLSLNYQADGSSRGQLGLQVNNSDFSAQGNEAIVPNTRSTDLALFAMHSMSLHDRLALDMALRIENNNLDVATNALDTAHLALCSSSIAEVNDRQFEQASVSLGAKFDVTNLLILRTHISRVSRAPQAQELYSCGVHESTLSFEIGNVNLKNESAFNIDAAIEWQYADINMQVSLYRNDFSNFIYQKNVNTIIEDLSAYEYSQHSVYLQGYEAQINWPFNNGLAVNVFADGVEAKFEGGSIDGGYVPRMPSDRAGIELTFTKVYWDIYLRSSHYQTQNKLADNETVTDGFNLVSLGGNYMFANVPELTLYAVMNNALDKNVQYHTSFVKDMVAQPGRNIKLGFNYEI